MNKKACFFMIIGALFLSLVSNDSFATSKEDIGSINAYVESIIFPNYNYSTTQTGKIYKTYHEPSINTAAQALTALKFADTVHTESEKPVGYRRVENISDYSSGFYASVFIGGKGDVVVAFRGSELGTADWVTNGFMVKNEVPAQYEFAITESLRLKDKYSGKTIHFTGHSLGGGLASVAAIATGYPATVFDSSGVGQAVLEEIKDTLNQRGESAEQWMSNAEKITNFNLRGEFVSDGDNQQDADTLGVNSYQYGDIYYLSDFRFTALPLVKNGLTRHFTTPLREELEFLAKPIYRVNPSNRNLINNNINIFTALWYVDWTDDTVQTIEWSIKYSVNSLPSLLADLSF